MSQLLVEAGAGCGKTYSIVSEYVQALGYHPDTGKKLKSNGCHPSEILTLTFTNDAAQEMKERILSRLNNLKLESLAHSVQEQGRISTFHSLCLLLIRPQLLELGYESEELLSASEARQVRGKSILHALSEAEECRSLLRLASLHEVVELSLDYLFIDKNPLEILKKNLLKADENFKRFCDRWNSEKSNLFAAFPEFAKEKSEQWPGFFFRSLENPLPSDAYLFNFRPAAKVKKEFPEIFKAANQYRELLRSPLFPVLTQEGRQRETEAFETIFNWILKLQRTLPKILDFQALEYECHALSQKENDWPKFKMVVVDEFQDTNLRQYEIVQALSESESRFYFVGDPKQSIYSFRGGDVSLFMEKRKDMELRQLETNYRSDARVLQFCNQLQEKLFSVEAPWEASSQSLNPADQDDPPPTLKDPIRLHRFAQGDIRDSYFSKAVIDEILLRTKENPDSTQAVLFQSWKKLYHFAQDLDSSSIPYRISGSENYLEHHLTELFITYLGYLKSPEKSAWPLAFLRFCEKEWSGDWGRPSTLHEALQCFVVHLQIERWKSGRHWIGAAEKIAEKISTRFEVNYLMDPQRWSELFKDLSQENLSTPALDSNSSMLELLTIHKSKGLEWDIVYLPDLYQRSQSHADVDAESNLETSFPIKLSRGQNDEQHSFFHAQQRRQYKIQLEAEKKRLFYVALTRAKGALSIFFRSHRESGPKADPLEILGCAPIKAAYWPQFIEDALKEKIENVELVEHKAPEDVGKSESLEMSTGDKDAQELWQWPLPYQEKQHDQFFRGGVRDFLETLDPTFIESENGKELHKFVSDASMQGTELHKAVELWNGDVEILDEVLLGWKNSKSYKKILLELRSLERLEELWQDHKKHPERIQKEFNLLLLSEEYSLSGKADLIWFRNRDRVEIIDWKSAGKLESLKSPLRLQKTRDQLSLYASAFKEHFKEIRLLGVGLCLDESAPKLADILFDERL